MRKKRSKVGSKSYYTKKLDTIFSEYIRARGKCEKCGTTKSLQCAHVHSRRNKAMRWDPFNALCLCYHCHLHWAHKEPRDFTQWFDNKFRQRAIYLDKNKNNIYQARAEDLKELYEFYKSRIKELEER